VSAVRELPPLVLAPVLALAGGPLLALGLRSLAARVPAAPAVSVRWTALDLVGLLALLSGSALLLARLDLSGSILGQLLLMQLTLALGAAHVLLAARRWPEGRASLGLTTGAAGRACAQLPLLYVPLCLCFWSLALAWTHLARSQGWAEEQEILASILALTGPELAVAGLLAVVVGPFLEELLFRGFLLSACTGWLGPRAALVTTSLLFAALHGTVGLPGLLLLSLVLGWLRQRSGSLLVPFALHALHNGVTLALALRLGIQ